MNGLFRFLKRRREEKQQREAEYQAGREDTDSIVGAVDGYLNPRLLQLSRNLLAVLGKRFATICDDPEYDPKIIAHIEWDLFNEQLQAFPDRVQKELQENVGEWLDLASEIGHREFLDQYIGQRISDAEVELHFNSLIMRAEAIAGIDKPKDTPEAVA